MLVTKQEAVNLLKLIDRALKNSPHEGGVQDNQVTALLIHKLNAVATAEEADVQDVSGAN